MSAFWLGAMAWLEQRSAELARLPVLARRVWPALRRARASGATPFLVWLERHADQHPQALFCEQDEARVSFAEARNSARRMAGALRARGVRRGDVVALLAGNSPQYLVVLLAIAYAGATAALLDPELRGVPLRQALAATRPRLTVVESRCRAALLELAAHAGAEVLDFAPGELDRLAWGGQEIRAPRVDFKADFVLIFTSGTTGLPKPCRVSHERARAAATIFGSVAFEFRRGDKLYCALPLHHASALLIGVGAALVAGVPIALRRKFSARDFASDLVRYDATATLYIGDVCRALVHSSRSDAERHLRLRVAVGNGLESHIWAEFQRRFGRPVIREFYASAEAPAAILNITGKPGSLGHVPFERRRGFRLARLDEATQELARDESGRAGECRADEPGELLLRIFPSARDPQGAFCGYTDGSASATRVAHDVFELGDAYFRAGDLLRRDAQGYFYFVDRLGDGFRWKGENVSALQVERLLSAQLGFSAVSVFGVLVPGYPGRAGFAEVVSSATEPFDAARFAGAASVLPSHARPCFVRPVAALDLTSSLKIKKRALELASLLELETLWVRQGDSYVVLTRNLWDDLGRGQARL